MFRRKGSPDAQKKKPAGNEPSQNMPVWKPSSELMKAIVESERPMARSSSAPPAGPAIPSLGVPKLDIPKFDVPRLDDPSDAAETVLRPAPAPGTDGMLPSPELLEAMLKEGGLA